MKQIERGSVNSDDKASFDADMESHLSKSDNDSDILGLRDDSDVTSSASDLNRISSSSNSRSCSSSTDDSENEVQESLFPNMTCKSDSGETEDTTFMNAGWGRLKGKSGSFDREEDRDIVPYFVQACVHSL
ncbi:hypothetical protein BDV12DRAFT_196318 [Aspergillus spectabilis]